MKRFHMKLAVLPLACLAITVAGCGGGGGGSNATPAGTATTPSAGAGSGTGTVAGSGAGTGSGAATTTAPASGALLSGTTDPGPATGKDGDFYLNTVTWMFFGPKTNGAWPAGVSLAGPAGPKGDTGATGNTGASGNTILSGTADPTDSVGNNGDYYINTTTSMLFGPKANGTWPAGVALGGGGSSGSGGGVVLAGAGAPGNGIGNNGDYYLDTNTWTLYGPKANDTWPAGVSLTNPPGGSGAGTGGSGGSSGSSGGGHILSGSGAPNDSIGVDGDFYFDTLTGTLYGPKQGGKWPASGATVTTGTLYNGNFNVPDSLSRGQYVMTGSGGAIPLPSDLGVVVPYDCTRVTLTAATLGKPKGTLDLSVYKVTGSGASAIITPINGLSCKISNGKQDCSTQVPAGTVNHGDKVQVQVDNNQATAWGGLTVNLACAR
ncbi:hypothetical protein [Cupriavidus basilensis]|uniref:hypothetical protein n=1 Tax=Cupriavidus basilensis TaxID=68895 RepID=UPI0023E7F4D3|nr:hypothetical protein [Cupriavidus basilensis]MDF3881170.1 hypothetical protein [Cupriavidus basilensis]